MNFINKYYLSQLLIVALLSCVFIKPLLAKERPWIKLSNNYFLIYSHASEQKTLRLLLELDKFRVAAQQITQVQVPKDALRTIVFLLKSSNEFAEYRWSRIVAGYVSSVAGRRVIVMHAGSSDKWAKEVIRHEYVHVIFSYAKDSFPQWYMEGLAELLSSINVGEESFEYGLVPSRSKIGKPVTSWNEVFSDDYNPHVERDAERASSAYSQFWLVAHYALLNADADVDLNEYLRLWENGTPSLVAFETTFGASPKKLWDSELREYSRRIPYYPISFDTEQLDKEIRTEDAQDEEVQPIRDYLRILAKSKAGKYETVDVYAALSGSWGSASIDNSCPDRTTIQISDDKALITMERPEGFSFGDDGHYERLTYRIRSHKKNEFLTDLEQEWRTNDEGKLVSWYLVMPSNDWFCWRRADWDGKTCVAFHHRCEN